MSEKFFLSREITKNVKFSESVAKKKKNPMQKRKTFRREILPARFSFSCTPVPDP